MGPQWGNAAFWGAWPCVSAEGLMRIFELPKRLLDFLGDPGQNTGPAQCPYRADRKRQVKARRGWTRFSYARYGLSRMRWRQVGPWAWEPRTSADSKLVLEAPAREPAWSAPGYLLIPLLYTMSLRLGRRGSVQGSGSRRQGRFERAWLCGPGRAGGAFPFSPWPVGSTGARVCPWRLCAPPLNSLCARRWIRVSSPKCIPRRGGSGWTDRWTVSILTSCVFRRF